MRSSLHSARPMWIFGSVILPRFSVNLTVSSRSTAERSRIFRSMNARKNRRKLLPNPCRRLIKFAHLLSFTMNTSAVMPMTTLQEKPINIWLRSPDADSVTNRSEFLRQKKEKGRTDHEEDYYHRKCRCYVCDRSGYHHREAHKVR